MTIEERSLLQSSVKELTIFQTPSLYKIRFKTHAILECGTERARKAIPVYVDMWHANNQRYCSLG